MARKKDRSKAPQQPPKSKDSSQTTGEQLDLLDVQPKHLKKIIAHARNYRAAVQRRMAALEEEVAEKQALLELIKAENLQRLENGQIRFKLDGMLITVTPRDELIRVKEEADESEAV